MQHDVHQLEGNMIEFSGTPVLKQREQVVERWASHTTGLLQTLLPAPTLLLAASGLRAQGLCFSDTEPHPRGYNRPKRTHTTRLFANFDVRFLPELSRLSGRRTTWNPGV